MFDPSFLPLASGDDGDDGADGDERGKTRGGAAAILPPSLLVGLLRPRPWVLVSDGSFNGYFDWVPKKQRVGPWSILAPATLFCLLSFVVYLKPSDLTFCASFPDSFTPYWYYNVAASGWMSYVLFRNVRAEGIIVPFTTFTVWSWTMLLARHLLSATAPFLPSSDVDHPLVRWSESLRCPSLLNAFLVTFVWNLVLAPGIYLFSMETPERRSAFVRWLLQFNLLNQHGLNLPLAIVSAVLSSPRRFSSGDLWCGVSVVLLYLCFYLLVLDRLGVHLYPIFSPRSPWCAVVWTGVALGYCGLFRLLRSWTESEWMGLQFNVCLD